MELKTQALARAIEALSPALAAELDRVAQETREALEQEFQGRLQAAVQEAETATASACAIQLDRAVAEAKDETRKQVSEELQQQFREELNDTTARLSNEAEAARIKLNQEAEAARTKLSREVAAERAVLQDEIDQWKTFAETQRQLGEASSQSEILSRFLRLVHPFADGLALYVTKADGLALWKSRGRGAFPEIISQETTDPESYFKIISVRGKVVAAMCAAPAFNREALDFLAGSLERAIETFGLKLRAQAPKPAISETTVAVSSTPVAPAAAPAVTSLSPEDQKVHAEARRTARLLVSEIKLYHEQELESGRQHGDIYQRLQKEIDLGRDAYSHRVPKDVLVAHDYFHEELVRILGGNDVSRLGPAYPGPMKS